MESVLFKILAFVVAIGILVAVHEFGHFWVARKLGVKVLRFSIGFGRPLWQWRGRRDDTEYVIAAVPLGGYVKMLDEREGPVPPAETGRAFNRQSLRVRSAIVVAGPAFNFLFAILAFWLVLVAGETGLRPLVGAVSEASPAALAGMRDGDEIVAVAGESTPTWSAVLYRIAAASVEDDGEVRLELRRADGRPADGTLPASVIGDLAERDDLLGDLGITPFRPTLPAVIGEVLDGEAAAAAGLLSGDRVVRADGEAIADWGTWVEFVRARPKQVIKLEIERAGEPMTLDLIPAELKLDDGSTIGRIGASNEVPEGFLDEYRVVYRLGPLAALPVAADRTLEFSVLTLKVVGRILTGQASVRNLSGPLTIADTAGRSDSVGWVQFVKFLAIVSISLGVLNLLPIPVLDGGHLVFFALEAVKGQPLSEAFLMQGQRVGLAILLCLMGLAFYVDISRFFG
ncbi:MAG: RIP metalloprotease RseP [Gammaproteobacteria bacterium]